MGGGLSQSRVVRGMVFGREPEGEFGWEATSRAEAYLVLSYRNRPQGCQRQGRSIHLRYRHRADRDQGNSSAQELGGAAQLLARRGEAHGEGALSVHSSSRLMLTIVCIFQIFQEIADSGLNVLVAGSSIGELALHYLNRHGILVVKVLSKFDLRRLCRVVGATPLARLGAPTIDEMGQCDVVETVEIGGDRVTVFRQAEEATRTATVVVRGATTNQMDDVERAIDDGINVVKGIIKDPRLVAGAGATELELAKRIAEFGEKTPGLAQHAIKRFADALEVVPRTLAENAGLDATEVLSRLYAAHQANEEGLVGVDIEVSSCGLRSTRDEKLIRSTRQAENGGTLDAKKAEIFDLLAATRWAIRYGTDAAISVLRVDSIMYGSCALFRRRFADPAFFLATA